MRAHLGCLWTLCIYLVICSRALPSAALPICPRHTVRDGDTFSSIAEQYQINLGDLFDSAQACGVSRDALPSPGYSICLPGGEWIGCEHVQSFQGQDTCRYYVVQAGDSLDYIALGLTLYLQDLRALNSDRGQTAQDFKQGDLIRLPPWAATCGELPRNLVDFARLPLPPPPAPPQTARKPPPGGSKSPDVPSIGRAPTQEGVVGPPSDNCRAYRATDGDSIFTIATAFSVNVAALMQSNPDLAGSPLRPGMVIRLPPYDLACPAPILVSRDAGEAPGAEQSATAPLTAPTADAKTPKVPNPLPPVAVFPPTAGEKSASAPRVGVDATTTDSTELAVESLYSGRVDIVNDRLANNGMTRDGTSPIIILNIVNDEASGAAEAPPPPRPNTNTGIFITGACMFFIALAVLAMMGMACNGGMSWVRSNKHKHPHPEDAAV